MSSGGTTGANLGGAGLQAGNRTPEEALGCGAVPHLVDAILLWFCRLGSMLFFLLVVVTVFLNQGFKNIPTLQEKATEVSGAAVIALRSLRSPTDSSPWPSSLLGEPVQALK